ncbi:MAG: hypothetical protein U9R56_03920, partial [candidate division Zixibacteria bacterium]|nr:hypothetical protein [candidate division Zixibacteria bacterium]
TNGSPIALSLSIMGKKYTCFGGKKAKKVKIPLLLLDDITYLYKPQRVIVVQNEFFELDS